ncbi:MAG: outer membrane beta-barrel protein [Alphaproteobacteria bacterium]|nr:outer membrane beta-barrel protein [Alphaproteobacteria bacterium]
MNHRLHPWFCGPIFVVTAALAAAPALGFSGQNGGDPAFDVTSTITLRGSADFRQGESGVFSLTVRPQTRISYEGVGASASLDFGTDYVVPMQGDTIVEGFDARLNGERRIGGGLAVFGEAGIDLSRLDPADSGLPATVAIAPLRTGFDGSIRIENSVGRLQSTFGLGVAREIFGLSVLEDDTLVSNADRNRFVLSANSRVGFELTPLVGVFADWSYARDRFDAPSPSLGVFMDGTILEGRIGVGYARGTSFGAELAVGATRRGFDDPALAETLAFGWNGAANWSGGRGLALDIFAGSNLDVSTRPGATTQTEQSAGVNASFAVTEKLTLRGSGSLAATRYAGLPDTQMVAGAGAGLDFAINRFMSLTTDYRYTFTDDSVDGQSSRQTIEAGLVFAR